MPKGAEESELYNENAFIFKEDNFALAGWLSWLEHHPHTPGLRIQSPVRAL